MQRQLETAFPTRHTRKGRKHTVVLSKRRQKHGSVVSYYLLLGLNRSARMSLACLQPTMLTLVLPARYPHRKHPARRPLILPRPQHRHLLRLHCPPTLVIHPHLPLRPQHRLQPLLCQQNPQHRDPHPAQVCLRFLRRQSQPPDPGIHSAGVRLCE